MVKLNLLFYLLVTLDIQLQELGVWLGVCAHGQWASMCTTVFACVCVCVSACLPQEQLGQLERLHYMFGKAPEGFCSSHA